MQKIFVNSFSADSFYSFSIEKIINVSFPSSSIVTYTEDMRKTPKKHEKIVIIVDGVHLTEGADFIRRSINSNNVGIIVIAPEIILKLLFVLFKNKEVGVQWLRKDCSKDDLISTILCVGPAFLQHHIQRDPILTNKQSYIITSLLEGTSMAALSKLLKKNCKTISSHKINAIKRLNISKLPRVLSIIAYQDLVKYINYISNDK